MTEKEAMAELSAAQHNVVCAQTELDSAVAKLLAAKAAFAKVRPLTKDEREIIAKRVESGGAICCAEGKRWLKERLNLPELWLNELNFWAYEALACSEDRKGWLRKYAAKVRALKLDELPPSASR